MIENQNPCANLTDNPQYLEWFLTREQELLEGVEVVDLPVEQDIIPSIVSRSKLVNGVTLPTVFVKDGEPSADVYKKLLYSSLFKANSSSRARDSDSDYKTTQGEEKTLGGHVTVATDLEAIARNNGNEDKETRVPRTSQLTSADEAPNSAIANYDITTISATPTDGIDVDRDTSVLTRSHYLTKLTDNFLNWIKDSYNKIKTYIDTVNVRNGIITINQLPNAINIVKTPATGTSTNLFDVNFSLFASTDSTFAGNSPSTLVSEQAIKTAYDNLLADINTRALQTDLNLLVDRVALMEGTTPEEKANLSELNALTVTISNLANVTANESISGTWAYTVIPTVPDGGTGLQVINRNTLTSVLANYVTTTSLGTTTSNIQASIDSLTARVVALENTVAAFPATYYTKTEIDNLLLDKSDVNHTHTGTYQPFVNGGLTGTKVLRQNSTITTTNGVVTGITT